MADIAIITGATGGIGTEFVKAIHPSEDIGAKLVKPLRKPVNSMFS